jgi:hypothetical protein
MAIIAGCKANTWGNAESSPNLILKLDRVTKVLDHLEATDSERSAILSAYASTPLSPFQEKRREHFEKLRARRVALRDVNALRGALLEVLDRMDPGTVCECSVAQGYQCAWCQAMRAIGCEDGFLSYDQARSVVADIDPDQKLQKRLTPAMAAAIVARSTGSPQVVDSADDFG